MKMLLSVAFLPPVIVAISLFLGCGHKGSDDRAHEEALQSGASFKTGQGILLTDEMQKILGVEIADVAERKLPKELRFTVQVFGEKHHPSVNPQDHSGCDVQGSGFLSTDAAVAVRAGQAAQLRHGTNAPLMGVVLSVQPALTRDESEIVLGVSNAAARLKPGEFVTTSLSLPGGEAVMAVPQAALLRTVEGAFVFAGNGGAYTRTAVKTGVESDGFVEITDGLLAGDQVVTNGVAALWLVELRATKGGAGCCIPRKKPDAQPAP